jgi:hypothetical protein
MWDKPADFADRKSWLTDYSHGDAGVFLVDCLDWEVRCFGGYGLMDEDEAA